MTALLLVYSPIRRKQVRNCFIGVKPVRSSVCYSGARFSKVLVTFRPRKAISKTTELFMSTGFAFKQSLHLCSFSNPRLFLVFQLRTFKDRFSGPKTFRNFRETSPLDQRRCYMLKQSNVTIVTPAYLTFPLFSC